MGRRSTVETHPRFSEIEEALRKNVPVRSVSDQFGVSLAALYRYINKTAGNQQPASAPGEDVSPATPLADTPAALSPPAAALGTPLSNRNQLERVSIGSPDPYDVLSLSYTWQPGEIRPDQKNALKLRATQRQLGIEAVKIEALALTAEWSEMSARISIFSFARMTDVPVPVVEQWHTDMRKAELDALTNLDPNQRLAAELAGMDRDIARLNAQLAEPSLRGKDRVRAELTRTKLRLEERRERFLERHHLIQFKPDPRDPAVKDLHGLFKELCADFIKAKDALGENGVDPDRAAPDEVAEARELYIAALDQGRDLPEFDPEDCWGWGETRQASRRAQARKMATGREHQGNSRGDEDPIPGWKWMPRDLAPVVEHLRAIAARPVTEPDDEPEDPEDGPVDTGCTAEPPVTEPEAPAEPEPEPPAPEPVVTPPPRRPAPEQPRSINPFAGLRIG